jgi:hypothetical protein
MEKNCAKLHTRKNPTCREKKAFVWNSEQPVARLSAKEWQLQHLIEYLRSGNSLRQI